MAILEIVSTSNDPGEMILDRVDDGVVLDSLSSGSNELKIPEVISSGPGGSGETSFTFIG